MDFFHPERLTYSAGARYPSGKGEVCKTFMRRFDSDPRLQISGPGRCRQRVPQIKLTVGASPLVRDDKPEIRLKSVAVRVLIELSFQPELGIKVPPRRTTFGVFCFINARLERKGTLGKPIAAVA